VVDAIPFTRVELLNTSKRRARKGIFKFVLVQTRQPDLVKERLSAWD